VSPLLGKSAWDSTFIGDIERSTSARKLRWLGVRPRGTIDGLMMFGIDGRMYPAAVVGASSMPRPPQASCWPEHAGRIVIQLSAPPPVYTWELRIGYFWPSAAPGLVTVQYGPALLELAVRPGVHSGYLPVTGSVRTIVVSALSGARMCIAEAQAGSLAPNLAGPAIPAIPAVP
jgi:hypothetical protein